jgi:hypothetical protein
MKRAYFGMLGLLCSVFENEAVYAESPEITLKKENIQVATSNNGACSASYYPSKYLDKKYYSGVMHCYQCIKPATWHKKTHTCS